LVLAYNAQALFAEHKIILSNNLFNSAKYGNDGVKSGSRIFYKQLGTSAVQ